jgi:hypothetical protein
VFPVFLRWVIGFYGMSAKLAFGSLFDCDVYAQLPCEAVLTDDMNMIVGF